MPQASSVPTQLSTSSQMPSGSASWTHRHTRPRRRAGCHHNRSRRPGCSHNHIRRCRQDRCRCRKRQAYLRRCPRRHKCRLGRGLGRKEPPHTPKASSWLKFHSPGRCCASALVDVAGTVDAAGVQRSTQVSTSSQMPSWSRSWTQRRHTRPRRQAGCHCNRSRPKGCWCSHIQMREGPPHTPQASSSFPIAVAVALRDARACCHGTGTIAPWGQASN